MKKRATAGFTLVELLVVLAIMTILATYAYPGYQEHVSKTRRTEGQILLLDVIAKEERFFTENNTYTLDLTDLGYALNLDGELETESGFYDITANACNVGGVDLPITNCVQLTATPPAGSPQINDGSLSINSRNQKSRTRGANTFDW